VFDLFDGRMAEKHGGTRFGPYLDDIADLISFGLCPAILIVVKGKTGILPIVFGLLYFLSVAFRLWRYLRHDKDDQTLAPGIFNGLPSPAGAMVTLGACLFWKSLWVTGSIILITSFLLVSHIRFIHFGRVILRRTPRTLVVIFGFIIVLLSAYLIKVKNAETLGILLLISFGIYLILGNNRVAGKLTFHND
jgi:CDP-diacylglycerol--serine O-phosphatidyltransferase